MSLRVGRYLSHSNHSYSYSVEQFKNGKLSHLGVFDETSFIEFLKRGKYKKYTIVDLKAKKDLYPCEINLKDN